jgi:hypothetical protein
MGCGALLLGGLWGGWQRPHDQGGPQCIAAVAPALVVHGCWVGGSCGPVAFRSHSFLSHAPSIHITSSPLTDPYHIRQGIAGLFKAGWTTIKGALVMPLMAQVGRAPRVCVTVWFV